MPNAWITANNTPTITVTAPNGGETWQAGSTYSITWTTSDPSSVISYFKAAYSLDGGSTWSDVSTNAVSSPYSWTIPSSLSSTQARVRIRGMDSAQYIKASDTSDANFTIQTPSGQVVGIDVNHNQGNITWSQVAGAGKIFAFIKATDGYTGPGALVNGTDPMFVTNITGAATAGIVAGAYHFARPYDEPPYIDGDPVHQADQFVNVAGPFLTAGHLPPVLDVEDPDDDPSHHPGQDLGKTALSAWVVQWVGEVKRLTGIDPIIYCNGEYASNYLDATVTSYPLWIANPNGVPGSPGNTGSWGTWTFHQYDWYGRVNGIGGGTVDVCLDVFNGDLSTFNSTMVISTPTPRYTLTLTPSPSAGGSISPNPAAGSDGKYAAGTVVTLTPNPASGYSFSSWSGDLSGSDNPGQITMSGNKSVTANFTIPDTPIITSPPPGSTLASSSVLFQWSSGTGVTEFFLYAGTSLGANDLYGQDQGLSLSATVGGLPTDGSTIYVRLYWLTAGVWQYSDYTYTAASSTPPPNDSFANRTTLSGAVGQATGTNVGATKEAGEPNHPDNSGGKSVWWSWTAPSSGNVTIDTLGSSFDTLLAVYTGSSVSGLSWVASNDDAVLGIIVQSLVTFAAVGGTTYQIAVDGYGGSSGSIVLNRNLSGVPQPAINPNPGNGATQVPISVSLGWADGGGATSYDVYFGTSNPPAWRGNQPGTTYNPGTLAYSTTYYWRIDAKNSAGTTTGDVWSFTTGAAPPQPPSKATSPSPANGATGQSINVGLSWSNGGGATSYDVYFGTSNPPPSRGNQPGATYNPGTLAYSTTYYWRIDAKNSAGTTTGDPWSFTTGIAPPSKAISPSPSNGATGQSISTTLGWSNGGGATSYDVYFGTSNPPASRGNQPGTTYNPGTLAYSTTYYWRIDAKNSAGTTTGDPWSFTTQPVPPPLAVPEILPTGQIYKPPIQVTITCSEAGGMIHYTTDGSEPTETSTVYPAGGFNLDGPLGENRTVKARAFKAGFAPSDPPSSRTYMFREKLSIRGYAKTQAGDLMSSVTILSENGDCSAVTGADGSYVLTVDCGWSGKLSALKPGYCFVPYWREYVDLHDLRWVQNFYGSEGVQITGRILSHGEKLQGAVVCSSDKHWWAVTNEEGVYILTVPTGWSGIVCPSMQGCVFYPAARGYDSPVTVTQENQWFFVKSETAAKGWELYE